MSTSASVPTGGAPVRSVVQLTPPGRRRHEERAEVQGTLALDLEVESPPPPPETPELEPARSSRPQEPDARLRGWVARLAQAAVETATGQRPTSQLVRWTTPEVHYELVARHRAVTAVPARMSRRLRPQVRSVHVCRPAPDALEASVHVRHGERSRALALRLEERDGRWICTAVEFG